MHTLSVTPPLNRRRRHTPAFKARIVSACQQPGVSVSRIALDNGLNTNMVRRWIRESKRADASDLPAFVPLLPAALPRPQSSGPGCIRIEIPHAGGPVVVEWPAEQAHHCAALLRELLQ
ncbi:IS66-like element accessory protein TnpA [Sedimenticola selenatireducens]|uniref:Transposase n=1 Tax=Sedimenticola selenatireducens TaxID=191960 RepID=A0A2N6CV31_9GAMM|nr:transposase [Sedimenticola selenatireducens]PLX61061.1 MAG: IS66 family insertion sequence hypothetical protein [Sedimenticola selenatireducens]